MSKAELKTSFELISKSLPDPIFIVSADGVILDASLLPLRRYGFKKKDFLGKNITELDFLPPWVMNALKQNLARRLQGKKVAPYEISLYTKDGKEHFFEVHASPIKYEGGTLDIALFRDITSRKEMERALQEWRREWLEIFNSLDDLVLFIDTEYNIIQVNKGVVELVKKPKKEIVGHKCYKILHDRNEPIANCPVAKSLKTGNVESLDYYEPRLDKYFLIKATPILDKDRRIMAIFILMRDITERKQAEEALRENEKRLRLLIQNAHDAIFRLELDKGYTFMSPSVESLLGYQPEDYYNDPTYYRKITLPDDLPKMENMISSLIEGKEPPKMFELRQFHKDGHLVHLEFTLTAVRDEAGKIAALEGVARDITERKQAEEELRQTVAELERSNTELERFAYVASHDLQEPLRMVSSYTQLLEKRYKDKLDGDAHDFIGYAVNGAKRMQQLINDLLTYSRVGTRSKPLEPTDSAAALDAAVANLNVTIRESSAVVTHDSLPTVMADEGQLIQLFQNLIDNAIKFRGEELPRIYVSAEQKRNEWVFSVRDNGIGINPQYFERIFTVFQRLHREEYPGTGIGLAICKKIVQRHGGRIWLESQPGKGTTVYFTIPTRGGKQS